MTNAKPKPGVSQNEGIPLWLEAKIKVLADELARYCGPIFVVASLDSEEILDGGTYALIDTGEKRLLVTCYHVWEKYEQRHDADNRTVLAVAVGDLVISFKEPMKHRIAFDRDLDLVVFEFEPETIPVPHNKCWFKIEDWPISKVNKGTSIVTLGYPGTLRTSAGPLCKVQSVPFPLLVNDTTARNIYAYFVKENEQVLNDLKDYLGGISGSPAYCYAENGKLRLVGFVKSGPLESSAPNRQYRAESGSPLSAVVSFTHASFLQRAGTLGHIDIPEMSKSQDSCSATKII